MIDVIPFWEDGVSWNQFVENHPEGHFCHLHEYGKVLECYGFKPNNICFTRAGNIIAVLPTTITKSILLGRRLVSQPYSEYGGLLLAPNASGGDALNILKLVVSYMKGCSVKTLEMHGIPKISDSQLEPMLSIRNKYMNATLNMDSTIEYIWGHVIHYEARKAVNKARSFNIKVISECNLQSIKRYFFPLYLLSMKRLGSPPHSIKYYIKCLELFKDKMVILWAEKEGKRIAGLLGFKCGSRVSIINTISNPQYWKYRVNDLLHWEFICLAKSGGYSYFDFGSVRYEGQERFKTKWGCELKENAYYFLLSGSHGNNPRTFNSSSIAMSKFSHIWANYIPAFLANTIGPFIRQFLVR